MCIRDRSVEIWRYEYEQLSPSNTFFRKFLIWCYEWVKLNMINNLCWYVSFFTGRYLFIESSWPRQTDEKAIVISETIPVTGNGKCVRFWYHMYGQNIGTLRVLMRVGYAISETVVWELSGNQGNKWQYGQAPMISGGQNIEVRKLDKWITARSLSC